MKSVFFQNLAKALANAVNPLDGVCESLYFPLPNAKSMIYETTNCPKVSKITFSDYSFTVLFSDRTKVVVNSKISRNSLLEALAIRTFADKIDLDSGLATCDHLNESLEKLLLLAKPESKPISIQVNSSPKESSAVKIPTEDHFDVFKNCNIAKSENASKTECNNKTLEKTLEKVLYDPNISFKGKKFKDMNQEEKRAYWRQQKAKQKEKRKASL